ncbi:hypothetical protein PNEG_01776 [Pneumocystis murina B123]|uniref:Signal recognition particle receptor subunit beta n=1 Tax=Pneumocystis murina (strain B123) TaxID=1069680 RepID=M7NRW5_PNEMU|nr:hypothetical protein PNEG_01776 [Pneumocystis murina B123]EMR10022.1 hypothetical protein PNEG_01776 [Pneumocystis murina B123]
MVQVEIAAFFTVICLIISLVFLRIFWRYKSLKKIVILGVQGSGKTSFFTKLCYGHKQKAYTSTQLNEAVCCFFPGKKVILVDFPGHLKFYHLFSEIKHIRCIVFMIDSSSMIKNADHVVYQLYRLLKDARSKKIRHILIAANKEDLFTSLPCTKISSIIEEKLSEIVLFRLRGIAEIDKEIDDDDDWLLNSEKTIHLNNIEGFDIAVLTGSVKNDHLSPWTNWMSRFF